jgi:hypothetical protein
VNTNLGLNVNPNRLSDSSLLNYARYSANNVNNILALGDPKSTVLGFLGGSAAMGLNRLVGEPISPFAASMIGSTIGIGAGNPAIRSVASQAYNSTKRLGNWAGNTFIKQPVEKWFNNSSIATKIDDALTPEAIIEAAHDGWILPKTT